MTCEAPKHCGFGPLPSLPAPKWHSIQSHVDGLDSRLCQESIPANTECFSVPILGAGIQGLLNFLLPLLETNYKSWSESKEKQSLVVDLEKMN